MRSIVYRIVTVVGVLGLILACSSLEQPKNKALSDYVNPFIGTGGHGHTYPGAASPFGMVQLSPDTRLTGWDGCSAYHYTDSIIYGFSHTHLSGTGISDYGDILLMPINGKMEYDNTAYCSVFSHQNEIAKAGFYSVLLDKHHTQVNLTTSERTGMHQYIFEKATDNKVILDLEHRDITKDAYLEQINDSTFVGYRNSKAWADDQPVYFYLQFSEKVKHFEISSKDSVFSAKTFHNPNIKASFSFGELKDNTLLVKIGLSSVDTTGARLNLEQENPNWDFEAFKQANIEKWNTILSKIEVKDTDEDKKTIFYTALYHNLIVPNIFSDVDGRYLGMDRQIHQSKTPQYTIFSLWDTYRATHPLYTLIETKRTNDFIHTFKNQYEQGGILPIWELAGNYTHCMIGYHAIPVIVDAYFKGLTDISGDTLLQMVLASAKSGKSGLKGIDKHGYVAIEDDSESVSKTLEYAYDDWCIAQLAKALGKDEIYKEFIQRAQAYKHLYDTESHNMRPKLREVWKTPFDPKEVDFNFTEANSWQYSFYVPQDVKGLIRLHEGADIFEQDLDRLFQSPSGLKGRHQSDITGLIGQYAHGNEPSHHMAYLYNYINRSAKTQKYVKQIMNDLYHNAPNGLSGNEDCGQMSAWYVFSAMGFYPVNPADGTYILGVPLFDELKLNLESGKTFTIKKTGSSSPDALVKAILLNGKPYAKAFITHQDLTENGTLEFIMDDKETIVFDEEGLPYSEITEHIILPVPAVRQGKTTFREQTEVILEAVKGAELFYQVNGGTVQKWQKPFTISETSEVLMWAEKEGLKSKKVKAYFYKIPEGRHINIKNPLSEQYAAGGKDALIDGLLGQNNFRTGAWQGYQFEDLELVVDLGQQQAIHKVNINFIQDTRSWIWMPKQVIFYGSNDSIHFVKLGAVKNDVSPYDDEVQIKNFGLKHLNNKQFRYVKLKATNRYRCPKGHLGEGGKAWIFADEIVIE